LDRPRDDRDFAGTMRAPGNCAWPWPKVAAMSVAIMGDRFQVMTQKPSKFDQLNDAVCRRNLFRETRQTDPLAFVHCVHGAKHFGTAPI
jgi:hypothetical protein